MKFFVGFIITTLAIISFVSGMMNMRIYGDSFGAPTFATAIIIGVFGFVAGVRMMLAK